MSKKWGEVPEYARRPLAESKAHEAAQAGREASRWANLGRRSDYLAGIAEAYPARDSRGYVVGYYVVEASAAGGRLAGPFPTPEAAHADEACGSLLKAGWARVVTAHVTTAKGRIVWAG